MKIPNWAQELTLDALIYLEKQGYKTNVPELTWRHGTSEYSTGRCQYDKQHIVVTAGKSRIDAKLVLLHELAHFVIGSKPIYWNIKRAKKSGWIFNQEPKEPIVIRHKHHPHEFWDLAWQLYRWAKLPIRYCQSREYGYRVQAQVAYRRNRKAKK